MTTNDLIRLSRIRLNIRRVPELDEVNCRDCSQRGFTASAWHDFSHLPSLFAGASRAMLLTFVDVEFGSEIERRGNLDEEGTPKEAPRLGQVARS